MRNVRRLLATAIAVIGLSFAAVPAYSAPFSYYELVSNMQGDAQTNFAKTMLRLASDNDELRVVGDQIGCPTYAQDLAKTIVIMVSKINSDIHSSEIFHYCGDSSCSWYSFAEAIFAECIKIGVKTPSSLYSIKTSSYLTKAARPAYSVLDCSKIEYALGINLSDWNEGIRKMLIKLKG